MELFINNTTYTLRTLNAERRQLFVDKVLVNYNFQAKNFDEFAELVRIELEKTHNLKMTVVQVKNNFFKNHLKNIKDVIWEFLKAEDKKDIGKAENIEIEVEDAKKFIEFICEKIRIYADYVKVNNSRAEKEDIHTIYSYLSRTYGWTFEEIKEMDELELTKAIEQAVILNKKENVDQINSVALAGAYAGGNKKAKSQIDKINKSLTTEINVRKLKRTNPELKMKNELTREQIQKIMDEEARNGR